MRNLGNTCFVSAALWSLKYCDAFVAALGRSKKPLSGPLSNLLSDPRSTVWPDVVALLSRIIGRNGSEPHDSHELLCAIIEHTGTQRIFAVRYSTIMMCRACGTPVRNKDVNTYANAEPCESGLVDGLLLACAVKTIQGRKCDKCREVGAAHVRTTPVAPGPAVLVVRGCAQRAWLERSFFLCEVEYVLRSVIVYTGNGANGHYTCVVPDTGSWRVHDDDSVRAISVEEKPGAARIAGAHTVLYERIKT